MVLLIIVSSIAVGISIYNCISFDAELAKYIYILLGVFLLPYEFLTTGKIEGIFQDQSNALVCFLISLAFLVAFVLVSVNSSRMFSNKYSSGKRTFSSVIAITFVFLFFAMFALSAVVLTAKYTQITIAIDNIGPELLKKLTTSFGFNALIVKELFIAYFGTVVCIYGLIFFIIGMSHKSTKVRILTSINFYSSEYQEPIQDNKTKEDDKKVEIVEMPETDPKAKDLVTKVMQLEELKKQGKISNTEYTQLRQRAIRRYKKWKSFSKILKSLLVKAT